MSESPLTPPEDKPKKPKKPSLADIAAAFEKRLEISSSSNLDRDALQEQDRVIQSLIMAADLPKPSSDRWVSHPFMAQIEDQASRRHPEAVRLLTMPRTKFKLFQRSKGENLLPNQDVVLNGLRLVFPRDNKSHECPVLVAEIFEQGEVG